MKQRNLIMVLNPVIKGRADYYRRFSGERYVDRIPIPCFFLLWQLAMMTRLARMVVADLPPHATQRGNRREAIFFEDGYPVALPQLRGRIVVPAAVISGGKNESIYVLSNRCCSSAAFRGRTYTRLSPV
jgi:hypothetical protein